MRYRIETTDGLVWAKLKLYGHGMLKDATDDLIVYFPDQKTAEQALKRIKKMETYRNWDVTFQIKEIETA